MKKTIFLSLFFITFSCNEKVIKNTTIKGTFIYFEDAAVLQSSNEIYGVYLDDRAIELIEKSKKLNAKENDEIIVELKGIVSTKSDDKIFWDKKFKINEILSIRLKKDKQKTLILGKK